MWAPVILSHKFSILVILAFVLDSSSLSVSPNGEPWKLRRNPVSDTCRCGERDPKITGESTNIGSLSRIFGGLDAEHGDKKWMALIDTGEGICSGSLINSKIVLTTAHCVGSHNGSSFIPAENIRVWLNRWSGNGSLLEQEDANSELHFVEEVITHPEYHSFRYDAALIVLKDEINFEESEIRPICIPNATDNYEFLGRADGLAFGYTWTYPDSGYDFPTNLQQAKVRFVELEECVHTFNYLLNLVGDEMQLLSMYDVETYLCAPTQFDPNSLLFPEKVDSGGPVTLPLAGHDSLRRLVQVGIVSSSNAHLIPEAQQFCPFVTYRDVVDFFTNIFHILPLIDSMSIMVNATWCTN